MSTVLKEVCYTQVNQDAKTVAVKLINEVISV